MAAQASSGQRAFVHVGTCVTQGFLHISRRFPVSFIEIGVPDGALAS